MSHIKWYSVEDIMKWDSVDFSDRNRHTMKGLLGKIRHDQQYDAVYESIRKYGFRKALSYTESCSGEIKHGDGHHRLAAAIELGYKYIPYNKYNGLAYDSWDFDWDNIGKYGSRNTQHLHPENPLPERIIKSKIKELQTLMAV